MNNSTIIVLVLVAVAIIGVLVYQSSVQAQRDRELQMQIAASTQGGTQQNTWLDSLGNLSGLVTAVGGLFGSGGSTTTTTTSGTSSGGFGSVGTTDWGLGGRLSQPYSSMITNDFNSTNVTPMQMANAKFDASRQAIADVNAGMTFN